MKNIPFDTVLSPCNLVLCILFSSSQLMSSFSPSTKVLMPSFILMSACECVKYLIYFVQRCIEED